MYIPRHWHFAYPVSTSMLGFWIMQHYSKTWDLWSVFLVLQYIAVGHATWIVILGYFAQRYFTQVRSDMVEKIENWHTGEIVGEMPMKTEPVYNQQVVTLPRFDKERYFAFTLIRMHENNFKVDMTETRWVKNWKFSRGELTSMLDNWKRRGIIEREGDKKNSSYEVVQWDAVRLIAQGNPLLH